MSMTVKVCATYDGDADQIFESALFFSEMADAMTGFATYTGFPASGTAQQGDTLTFKMVLWGIVKMPPHKVYIETISRAGRFIQSREHSKGIRRWDHHLSVQPVGGQVIWTDNVVIDAGWKTRLVAYFASYMYARRHKFRNAIRITQSLLDD
jgi:hypothetical protein